MDIFEQIAVKIISSQEAIIGPVAIEQAEEVPGISVDWPKHTVAISSDKPAAIQKLVNQYADLFGQISVEVSKQSVSALLSQVPAGSMPEVLK